MMMDSEEEEEQTALVCDNGKFATATKEIWSETCMKKNKKRHDRVSKMNSKIFIDEIFDAMWQKFTFARFRHGS